MKTDFLQIDELALDKECIRQPSLYFEFAEKVANARQAYDIASNEAKVEEAEVERDIRSAPEKHGLEKVTEASIKAAVACSKEVRLAQEHLIDLKHTLEIYQAAVFALEHKKRALTLLVNLRGQEYYAEPRTTAAGKSAVDEGAKKRVRQLGQRKADVEDKEDE